MGYKVKPVNFQAKDYLDFKDIPREKAYLGVSVDSPFIKGKHIERVLRWIDSNFTECVILIGDEVHRYNEMIFGHSKPLAKNKCRVLGEFAESKLRDGLELLKTDKFSMRHWNAYSSKPEFTTYKNQYQRMFKENARFSSAVIFCAEDFLKKQEKNGNPIIVSKEEGLKLSADYIIEEMAVFSLLIKSGYQTLIYPGTILPIFKEMVKNGFPGSNAILEEGIYIDLNIKKK